MADPDAPELTEVEINGVKYMVDPAMAKSMVAQNDLENEKFEKAQKDSDARFNELAGSINQPEPTPIIAEPSDDDDDVRFLTEPRKVITEIVNEATAKTKDELREEYTKTSSEANFWKKFYELNDDLSDADIVVKGIFNKNYNEYAPLQIEKTMEKLGNDVREYLMSYKPKGKDPEKTPVEPGGNVVTSIFDQEAPKDEKIVTMGDQIKNRKKARRDKRLTGTK